MATTDNRDYQALLAEAERQRKVQADKKDAVYARLVRRLRELEQLPVSYEQAVRQLCDKLNY